MTLFSNYCTIPLRNFTACETAANFSRFRDGKTLMVFRVRSTTRLPLSRLVSVSICFCVFAFLPPSQLIVGAWAESSQGECPHQEDGKKSEGKLVDWSSARSSLKDRRQRDLKRPISTGNRLYQIAASYAGGLPAIVGHQLANGLRAPLLI